MALVATPTKASVTITAVNQYSIGIRMVLTDNSVTVIDKVYSFDYHPGRDIAQLVLAVKARMQEDIDKYKAEQVVYGATAFTNAVAWVQANLTV